jgi:hypothetical protein
LETVVAPYWECSAPILTVADIPAAGLSVVILDSEFTGSFLDTIRSALFADIEDLEIVIATNADKSAPERSALLDRIGGMGSGGVSVRIAKLGYRGSHSSLANIGVANATKAIVAIARGGAIFDPLFLRDACLSMERHPDFDVVIPQIAHLTDSHEGISPRVTFDTVRIGGASHAAAHTNHFGGMEFVCRRSVLDNIRFDEALDRYIDWDFHLRTRLAGHCSIISNSVDVQIRVPTKPVAYRSHLDAALSKHYITTPALHVPLTFGLDAGFSRPAPEVPDSSEMLIAGRSMAYYLNERRHWWKIFLKHPTKPLRWLMVREARQRWRGR